MECFFPQVVRERKFIALPSISNGNCLYNSISLALFGSNIHCSELRVLACIELYLNADFYANHPHLLLIFEKNKESFRYFFSIFSCCISSHVFETFDKNTCTHVDLCKKEAFYNCEAKVWSVTERCITNFYPDKPDSNYRLLFNDQKVFPRDKDPDSMIKSTPINILFCNSTSPIEKRLIFKPTHYVLLFPGKPTTTNNVFLEKKKILQTRFIHNFFKRHGKTSSNT